MTKQEKTKIINNYCNNDLKELKKICNPIITRKGIPNMDWDDLYSDAMKTLMESVESFDNNNGCSFNTYLTRNINNSFWEWTRNKYRAKRCNVQRDQNGEMLKDESGLPVIIPDVSIDNYSDEEDSINFLEVIPSSFDVEKEISDKFIFMLSDKVYSYLESLSKEERRICRLIMSGYEKNDILRILNITEKKYKMLLDHMKSFEKSKIIYKKDNIKTEKYKKEKEIDCMENCVTMEKSKPDRLSIASIIKKIDNQLIRFEHPLQRLSDQWTSVMKSNLISDILQGNPIPSLVFAEQIINNLAIIWDLDGKQRCINVHEFYYNKYKISKNVRRWKISYQTIKKDINGNVLVDENGFPMSEKADCDIRGKKFLDLPEELQDRFKDYTFEIVQYLNCSSDDIAYHIARYNEGKPMTSSQKGIIRLGEDFAQYVKRISAMPFFTEEGSYTNAQKKNGSIDRAVVEGIMASFFIDDWKKDQDEMCEFLKENAKEDMFENFEDMVDRLTENCTEEVFEIFDIKNSFLWFGLFNRFSKLDIEDCRFVEFMKEFKNNLHDKEINGKSFDSLDINPENGKKRSTKDKATVLEKMDLLTDLMCHFLGINKEKMENKEVEQKKASNEDLLNFVKQNVDINATLDDIECYKDTLDSLTVEVDNNMELLNDENLESLIGIVAYSYENDIDLDNWFVDFVKRNETYVLNQTNNFNYMVKDLKEYTTSHLQAA